MNDDLGLFSDRATEIGGEADDYEAPAADEPLPDEAGLLRRERARRRRRRRTVLLTLAAVVLVLVVGGGWYGTRQVLDAVNYADYQGTGESDLIVQIKVGDSVAGIGARLVDNGVVASTQAFTSAAQKDSRSSTLQPGYYVMKTKMSGKAALAKLVDPQSRVGQLDIQGGYQLDDRAGTPGILTLLSKASCAQLNGKSTCVPVDALRTAMATADLTTLGVPDWAIPAASRADPQHRLEGLIVRGLYDVKPGSDALQLLKSVVQQSAAKLQALGMPSIAANTGFTPYQVLTVASLVEREAIAPDFGKVARVTYNRLAASSPQMPLQYDSTVNYPLDRPNIRTTDQDRAKPGPYNTYINIGLPPTPISSPSAEAIVAAANPPPGNWLYFVKCQKDGTTCFSANIAQHQAAVDSAIARGVW